MVGPPLRVDPFYAGGRIGCSSWLMTGVLDQGHLALFPVELPRQVLVARQAVQQLTRCSVDRLREAINLRRQLRADYLPLVVRQRLVKDSGMILSFQRVAVNRNSGAYSMSVSKQCLSAPISAVNQPTPVTRHRRLSGKQLYSDHYVIK